MCQASLDRLQKFCSRHSTPASGTNLTGASRPGAVIREQCRKKTLKDVFRLEADFAGALKQSFNGISEKGRKEAMRPVCFR